MAKLEERADQDLSNWEYDFPMQHEPDPHRSGVDWVLVHSTGELAFTPEDSPFAGMRDYAAA